MVIIPKLTPCLGKLFCFDRGLAEISVDLKLYLLLNPLYELYFLFRLPLFSDSTLKLHKLLFSNRTRPLGICAYLLLGHKSLNTSYSYL